MTLLISSWKPCDHFRTSAMALPTCRPASGSFLGPSTIRATTRMTRISAGPNEVGNVVLPGGTLTRLLAGGGAPCPTRRCQPSLLAALLVHGRPELGHLGLHAVEG